jgi:hypothetical protein
MSMLQSLIVALVVSLTISSVLAFALVRPLHGLLRQICPALEGENFWARFTVVMLFVAPMLVALTFGLPDGYAIDAFNAGQLVKKIISSTLFGAFMTLAGIGWKLSSFAPSKPLPNVQSIGAV